MSKINSQRGFQGICSIWLKVCRMCVCARVCEAFCLDLATPNPISLWLLPSNVTLTVSEVVTRRKKTNKTGANFAALMFSSKPGFEKIKATSRDRPRHPPALGPEVGSQRYTSVRIMVGGPGSSSRRFVLLLL